MSPGGRVYVALLRAVNVGGTAKLAMSDLRAVAEGLGAREVATYIQSGNLVFRHGERDGAGLTAELEAALGRLGLETTVMVRTGAELARVLADNPFADRPTDRLHVAFFSERPTPGALARARLGDHRPEEAVATRRELYLYLPDGVGRAKLPAALRRVGVPSTLRNWRTVSTLVEMAGGGPG